MARNGGFSCSGMVASHEPEYPNEVAARFDAFVAKDLPPVNDALKAKGAPAIQVPPARPVAQSDVSSADLDAAFSVWRGASFGRGTDLRGAKAKHVAR